MEIRILRNTLLALVVSLGISAQAAEIEGVKFEDRTQLGNTELALNGAGVRGRWFLKVYAVGLYLAAPQTTAAGALAAAGPKRLQIVTLWDLSGEQFADALVAGIENNHAAAEIAPLRARIEKFRELILDLESAPRGSVVMLDWLPDEGTRLTFAGAGRGEAIPGEDFYRAVLRIWLGEDPTQGDLKDALLGKPQ